MNTTIVLVILASIALAIVPFMIIPRFRMERRARALLAKYPDAERTSVYLLFRSALAVGKEQEMNAKVAEMAQAGWTYLRATEASPIRTIKSWGGGLNLHFMRRNPNNKQEGAADVPADSDNKGIQIRLA